MTSVKNKKEESEEIRIAIIGPTAVGKTSVTLQYIQKRFISSKGLVRQSSTEFLPSRENAFEAVQEFNNKKYHIYLYPNAGVEDFSQIKSQFMDVDGFVLICDATNPHQSLSDIQVWMKHILRAKESEVLPEKTRKKSGMPFYPIVLAANKSDLLNEEQKQALREQGNTFVNTFLRTSEPKKPSSSSRPSYTTPSPSPVVKETSPTLPSSPPTPRGLAARANSLGNLLKLSTKKEEEPQPDVPPLSLFYEVSAKDRTNIDQLFNTVLHQVVTYRKLKKKEEKKKKKTPRNTLLGFIQSSFEFGQNENNSSDSESSEDNEVEDLLLRAQFLKVPLLSSSQYEHDELVKNCKAVLQQQPQQGNPQQVDLLPVLSKLLAAYQKSYQNEQSLVAHCEQMASLIGRRASKK